MSAPMDKAAVLFRQRVLRQARLYHDTLDGDYGKNTAKANAEWERIYAGLRSLYGARDPRTEANLYTVLPKLQEKARRLLDIADSELTRYHSTIKVLSGTRTYAEQDALYAQGRTAPGDRVTKAKGGQSNHNYSIAIDVGIFLPDGSYLRDDTQQYPLYAKVARLSRQVPGLARGADWPKPDMPHYELAHGLKMAEVRRRFEKGIPIFTQ